MNQPTSSQFGRLIEKRAHQDAYKQAEAELTRITGTIQQALREIGVSEFQVPLYELIKAAHEVRTEALVRARLTALADRLMATPAAD